MKRYTVKMGTAIANCVPWLIYDETTKNLIASFSTQTDALEFCQLKNDQEPERIYMFNSLLPKPETKKPKEKSTYYMLSPIEEKGYFAATWKNDCFDNNAFRNCCVHLSIERAAQWAKWWQANVVNQINR